MKLTIVNIFIAILDIALVAGGVYFIFFSTPSEPETSNPVVAVFEPKPETQEGEIDGVEQDPATTTNQVVEEDAPSTVVFGTSVEGRDIVAHNFGEGETNILLVGGIHGGYEWNTILLAYRFIDYFKENSESIPENISVTVIPVLNPDGLEQVVGSATRFEPSDVPDSFEATVSGRFNANDVDLNRNFSCRWQAAANWQSREVGAGDEPFSEPETKALRDYVIEHEPEAAVFWHSQAGAVFASECNDGILPKTIDIMNAFAEASGYPAQRSFGAYPITGSAESWFSSLGIPTLMVELTTHKAIEWEKNLSGMKALFEYYGKEEDGTNEVSAESTEGEEEREAAASAQSGEAPPPPPSIPSM